MGAIYNSQLTKREELLFLIVLALPYASSAGFACTMASSRECPDLACGKDHTSHTVKRRRLFVKKKTMETAMPVIPQPVLVKGERHGMYIWEGAGLVTMSNIRVQSGREKGFMSRLGWERCQRI